MQESNKELKGELKEKAKQVQAADRSKQAADRSKQVGTINPTHACKETILLMPSHVPISVQLPSSCFPLC